MVSPCWLYELFCMPEIKTSSFAVPTEKLSQAKEENLDMHQMMDQTLMELNNLWRLNLTQCPVWFQL